MNPCTTSQRQIKITTTLHKGEEEFKCGHRECAKQAPLNLLAGPEPPQDPQSGGRWTSLPGLEGEQKGESERRLEKEGSEEGLWEPHLCRSNFSPLHNSHVIWAPGSHPEFKGGFKGAQTE